MAPTERLALRIQSAEAVDLFGRLVWGDEPRYFIE
jgi:hypothetical protein